MAEKLRILPISSATRTGNLVFVSGQGGLDPLTSAVVGPSLEEQTVQTMENILTILADNGLTFDHVKKANIYLAKREHYAEFNAIYARYFTNIFPARTTVYCELNYDLLVEIDVIAQLESGESQE
ncbi:RidA family protein [Paenibacillus agaridevorans]|uniref:RidA family protein n=1 Tax=Paenibacillus agaridevorans TaxID=171404 RepID=UPI001BE45F36|nr:RidA family protein [Paenibacillus agaridevorans]